MYHKRARADHHVMSTAPTPTVSRLVAQALAPGRSAHDRQRELVRASLLCPRRPKGQPPAGVTR
jgi:hypothetical protein